MRAGTGAGGVYAFVLHAAHLAEPARKCAVGTSLSRVAKTRAAILIRINIPCTLIPGGELNMTDATARLDFDDVVTYGMQKTHVLIDLWAESLPPFFEKSVKHLQSFGLTVILAHPERMRAVQGDPELADYFADLGLLLQCNLQCLGDPLHARRGSSPMVSSIATGISCSAVICIILRHCHCGCVGWSARLMR